MLYNVLGCSTTLRLNVEKYFYVSREIVSNNRLYLKLFHHSLSLFYFRLVLSTRCPIKKIQLLTTTNDFFGTVCGVQTEIDINRWGLKDVKIYPRKSKLNSGLLLMLLIMRAKLFVSLITSHNCNYNSIDKGLIFLGESRWITSITSTATYLF